jgi:hypothetical protein
MPILGLHDPFGYLKHKLCPKKGSGVKLPIRLLTIKSQELPWFPCLHVACYIPLERSQWGLQLCSKPHFNQRSKHKVIGLQSLRSPNFRNFETHNLGVSGQNNIWVQALWSYNPSIGLTTKARVCKVVGQEGSLGVTSSAPKSAKECEGMNSHTPKWTPILGIGVPMDFRIFKGKLKGSKPIELKHSLYYWKAIET